MEMRKWLYLKGNYFWRDRMFITFHFHDCRKKVTTYTSPREGHVEQEKKWWFGPKPDSPFPVANYQVRCRPPGKLLRPPSEQQCRSDAMLSLESSNTSNAETSWWFQPIWKIISQNKSFPQVRVKKKVFETTTCWNHLRNAVHCPFRRKHVMTKVQLFWVSTVTIPEGD